MAHRIINFRFWPTTAPFRIVLEDDREFEVRGGDTGDRLLGYVSVVQDWTYFNIYFRLPDEEKRYAVSMTVREVPNQIVFEDHINTLVGLAY